MRFSTLKNTTFPFFSGENELAHDNKLQNYAKVCKRKILPNNGKNFFSPLTLERLTGVRAEPIQKFYSQQFTRFFSN